MEYVNFCKKIYIAGVLTYGEFKESINFQSIFFELLVTWLNICRVKKSFLFNFFVENNEMTLLLQADCVVMLNNIRSWSMTTYIILKYCQLILMAKKSFNAAAPANKIGRAHV